MTYSQLWTTPTLRPWIVATVGTRLAVAMVPLASVLLAAAEVGSYAIGGLLAGGFCAGEAVLAPVMGRRSQNRPLRRELAVMVSCQAVLLGVTVAVVVNAHPWWPVAVATSAGAGGIAAGVPGALRSYISAAAETPLRNRALGTDAVITQATWLIAPALAAIASSWWGPAWPFVIIIAALACALPFIAKLDHRDKDSGLPTAARPIGQLLRVLVIPIVASSAVLALLAALDVLLPALIASHGAPQVISGLALAGLAAASMMSSAVYGSRNWKGQPGTHAQWALVAMGVLVASMSVADHALWLAVVLCVLVGATDAPALLGRNIALTRDLAPTEWPVGFSLLYASGGIGYTIGSTAAGQLIERSTITEGFAIMGIAVIGIVPVATLTNKLLNRRQRATDSEESSQHPSHGAPTVHRP